jgi:hypothetical protein
MGFGSFLLGLIQRFSHMLGLFLSYAEYLKSLYACSEDGKHSFTDPTWAYQDSAPPDK